jgi:hypothetical protein
LIKSVQSYQTPADFRMHVSLALVCRSLACMAPVPRSPSRCRWSPPRFHCLVLVICLAPACGMLHPCPCPHPGPGPCTSPSTLQAVAHSGGGGCWVVVPRASLSHASGPIIPSSPSLVLPVSTPQAVAHGGSSGCCCAGRHGRHSATGWGQRQCGRVMGAYLVGIPLQGSPSALCTLFIIRTLSLFVPHHRSILRSLSYVVCTLSYAVRLCLYVVIRRSSLFVRRHRLYVVVCMSLSFGPLYVVVHRSLSFICCCTLFIHCCLYVVVCCLYIIVHCLSLYIVIHCLSSFVCCPCGNVPRNIVENSLLVKDKKGERYKKTHLGPKRLLSSFGPAFLPID